MKKTFIISVLLIMALMQGCSVTGNLNKPRLDMPSAYEGKDSLYTDSLSLADLEWWDFYSDSTLVAIMKTTLANNHDLLKAASRIEQMRLTYGIAKANMLPQIGLDAGYNYETNKYDGGPLDKDPEWDLKFPITWEMNLWGSLQHARKAGAADYAASIEDYRALRMSLLAEVASVYIRLQALNNELHIVRQTLKTRDEALKQAKLRFEGGLTAETTLQQARVEYSTTASLVPALELQVVQTRNALTLLMGEYPKDSIEHRDFIFSPDFDSKVPAGVPSELLKRRPDLRSAENRLMAAMERVGVSYADRFPSLKIGFTPGLENDGLNDFLKSPFSYVISQITGTIFDFGRKKKKYQAAITLYDQSRLEYEKAVTTAFTEVSTSVTAYAKYCDNHKVKSKLRDAAAKYVQLAWLQYRGGSLNYIDVLDAQRRYFEAQIGVNNALRDKYLSLVNLYKSLGGGWSLAVDPQGIGDDTH